MACPARASVVLAIVLFSSGVLGLLNNATVWPTPNERLAACSTGLSTSNALSDDRARDVWRLDSGVLMFAEPIRYQKTRLAALNLWEAEEEDYWHLAFADAASCNACHDRASGRCTVLDVGAAYGYYSMLTRLRAPAGVRVHAFNPHPAFMKELRHNLILNQLDGTVCLHESAVSDKSGHDTSSLEYSVGSGITALNRLHEHGRGTRVRVNTTTLDDWAAATAPKLLAQKPAFLLIKLDIEGAAAMALRGAQLLLPQASKTQPRR